MIERRKKVRAFWGIVLSVIMLITLIVPKIPSRADGEIKSSSNVLNDKYNIMLVIDKSGSMKETDRDELALDAASMFIDQLDTNDCKIGAIAFDTDTELISEPIDIRDSNSKQTLKNAIVSIKYGNKNTDLGKAVNYATDVLSQNSEADRKNLIVLFTDGYTDGKDVDKVESQNLMDKGINTAKNELNCEIYVVGLNYGGNSIEEEGVQEISNISRNTQVGDGVEPPYSLDTNSGSGKVNYKITESAYEVYTFYQDIFAKLNGTEAISVEPEPEEIDNEIYTTFPVEISGVLVKEVNIYLVSEDDIKLDTLLIRDQESRYVDNSREDVVINSGKKYAFIKLIKPASGTWKFSIKGEVKSNLSYVIISDVDIDMTCTPTSGKLDVAVLIKTELHESGTDEGIDLFNEFTQKSVSVYDAGGAEVKTNQLEKTDKADVLEMNTSFELPEGEYTVKAVVGNENFTREAEAKVNISGQAATEDTTEKVLEYEHNRIITVYKGKTQDIKVNEFDYYIKNNYSDQTASSITDVTYSGNHATVSSSDTEISIKGDSVGEDTFVVKVLSSGNEEYTFNYKMEVKNDPAVIARNTAIIIGSVLALLALIISLIYKSRRCLPGEFDISISVKNMNGYMQPIRFNTSALKGSSFKLSKVVKLYIEENRRNNDLYNMLMKCYGNSISDLNKVKIYIGKSKTGKRKTYRYKRKGKPDRLVGGEIYQAGDLSKADTILGVRFTYESPNESKPIDNRW